MKHWEISLFGYIILIINSISMLGQENKSLELVKLLNDGEFYKSRQLYSLLCDTISPDIDLYYKFRMATFINKKDSAQIYLEKIFSEYPDLFGDETINMYGVLFDTYIYFRNMERGLFIYEHIKQHLKQNPYKIPQDELLEWSDDNEYRLSQLKSAIKQPPIRIKRKKTDETIRLINKLKLQVWAHFNNSPCRIIFDTGLQSFCVMSKSMAEHIGVKCDTSGISSGNINEHIPINKAIVDSIEIGNVTLYNIPVEVYEPDTLPYLSDSLSVDSETKESMNYSYSGFVTSIIVGLPLMQWIGKFLIDNENMELNFPVSDKYKSCSKEPNLFVYNENLYTHLKLNEKDFIGYLDTGADEFIAIDTVFYEKHKEDIKIDTITAIMPFNYVTLSHVRNNISYMIPDSPILRFEDRVIRILTKRSIKIYPVSSIVSIKFFDGLIGYHCFRRLGKRVLLDLDNMRLDVQE